jgi:hypothetical protein
MMFIENVIVYTFIANTEVWGELRTLTDAIYAARDTLKRMSIRKNRVSVFFYYMKKLYEPLKEESVRRGLPREWCVNPIGAIESDFKARLNRAMSSATRNYGSPEERENTA